MRLGIPADCPEWILHLPVWKPIADLLRDKLFMPHGERPRDPIGLAKSWGVRFAGKPSQSGWVPCHAVGREDHHPSAAIHQESGYYLDHGTGERYDLWELAVKLGAYHDRQAAITGLTR